MNSNTIEFQQEKLSLEHAYQRALNHLQADQLDLARDCFERILTVFPAHALIHNDLGVVLQKIGDYDTAILHHRQAIKLFPKFPEAYNNLGYALHQLYQYQSALTQFQLALNYKANFADALYNMAITYAAIEQDDLAIKTYQQVITLVPDHAQAHWNLAFCFFRQGDLCRAWQKYTWCWQTADYAAAWRAFPQDLWQQQSLHDKKILLWANQGIGDQIMFASLLPDILVQCQNVMLECERRLVPLFQRSFPSTQVVATNTPPVQICQDPDINYQAPIEYLAGYLRPELNSYQAQQQHYLHPKISQVKTLKQRYQALGEGKKIGIAWYSGNARYGQQRSLPRSILEKLLAIPNTVFISLQHGYPGDKGELNKLYHDKTIDALTNLDDYAAQIAAMDLVITIDNSCLHLAGALGISTYGLLSKSADWRWFGDDTYCYWYPTVKLFRQTQYGDWQAVIDKLAHVIST